MDKSSVTEKDDRAENELRTRVNTRDPESRRELVEDLTVAQQALEEYDSKGIEDTTFYTEYRAKRLGKKA